MSWLTPLGFLGLIGLIILIIIYIIKPNYQNKIISSTFVWKLSLKYKKNKIPISKLRNILLLICQILAITVSSLILAQPFIENDKPSSTNKVFIIDASASMTTTYGGETRFERAVNLVRDQAEEVLKMENGQVTIILAAEKASFLVDRADVSSRTEITMELDKLLDPALKSPCTYAGSDIDGAIKLAENVTGTESNVEVLLFTDNSYIDSGKVEIVPVRNDQEWNAAILDVRARIVENRYEIEIDVACYGGINRDVEVECVIVGTDIYANSVEHHLNLTARCDNSEIETVTLSFTHEDKEVAAALNDLESYTSIYVSIPEEDNFEMDNSFSLYGGDKLPLRIQYCSSKPNNYFDTALKVLRDRLSYRWDIEFKEIMLFDEENAHKQKEEPATEGFDVYIYEHMMPSILPTDGFVLLVNPNEEPAGSGFRLGREYNSYTDMTLSAGDDPNHPLLNNVNPEQITVTKYVEITSYDGYDAVLSCNNAPLLLVKNESDEKIAIMPFSLNFSNLPVILEFPLLMYNLIEYYIPSTVTEYVFDVNEKIELDSRSEELYITGGGNEVTATEFPFNMELKVPGTYTVIQTPISGVETIETFFVKMPASESNINAEYDALTPPYYYEEAENTSHEELLLYFAIALVTLLFAEWWLHTREQF